MTAECITALPDSQACSKACSSVQYVNEQLTQAYSMQLHWGKMLPNLQGPLVLRMVDKDSSMGLSWSRKTS